MSDRIASLTRRLYPCAALVVGALVVFLCAFCLPAWAQDDAAAGDAVTQESAEGQNDGENQDDAADRGDSADQGDASKKGSVVQGDAANQSERNERAQDSDTTSAGGASQASDGTNEGGASSESSTPEPLDAEGNLINEGQVSDTSFLYDAAIADLAGADAYYDGQTVQVTGEAVGEAIAPLMNVGEDSGMVRVTLYEESSGTSVTVIMTRENAEKIGTYGAYGKTGATLRVQGTFHLTCQEHEGESDIHADVVTVLKQGSVHPDEFEPEDFVPGVVALVIGLVCMLAGWRIKERSR